MTFNVSAKLESTVSTSADAPLPSAIAERSRGAGASGAGQAITGQQAALQAALDEVKASYKALHGRIEGNYTTLRQLDKRIKKIESP